MPNDVTFTLRSIVNVFFLNIKVRQHTSMCVVKLIDHNIELAHSSIANDISVNIYWEVDCDLLCSNNHMCASLSTYYLIAYIFVWLHIYSTTLAIRLGRSDDCAVFCFFFVVVCSSIACFIANEQRHMPKISTHMK